jgi:hypothetical protein
MFVLRAEIVTIFEPKMATISVRNIFQALQHFATKFCNFTNFIMFFLASWCLIPFSLLRLKFSLTCKLSVSFLSYSFVSSSWDRSLINLIYVSFSYLYID